MNSQYAAWYVVAWRLLWAAPTYFFWAGLWLCSLIGWGKDSADRVRNL